MPIDYSKYPKNWLKEIRPAILERAGHKCEFCGVKNHTFGYRDEIGRFIELTIDQMESYYYNQIMAPAENRIKAFKIILTIAHLDQDIKNNNHSNLRALCQCCHLRWDRYFRKNPDTIKKINEIIDQTIFISKIIGANL